MVGGAGLAVRLLPAGTDHDRGRAAAKESAPDRRADQDRNVGRAVPLWDLPAGHQGNSARGWRSTMKDSSSLTRRDFLKVSSVAGVGLVIGVYVSACNWLESDIGASTPTVQPPTATPQEDVFLSPNVFVTLGT